MRSGMTFVKVARAQHKDGEGERLDLESVSPTLNVFDIGDTRAVVLVTRRIGKTKCRTSQLTESTHRVP